MTSPIKITRGKQPPPPDPPPEPPLPPPVLLNA